MMAHITRDSVCAGDDIDAPHTHIVTLDEKLGVERLIEQAAKSAELPSIAGGRATWCISSAIPLAVIAQQWPGPKMLHQIPPKLSQLDIDGQTIRFHVSYFVQQDPNAVYETLRCLRIRP
jgi:hypothetical protein